MLRGKKVVVVIPSGRQRFMEILLPYLLREIDIIDGISLWVNTRHDADLAWIHAAAEQHDKITLDMRFAKTPELQTNANVTKFYTGCTDPGTVYVKIDDDVLWLEDNFIMHLVEFRLEHPAYFIVSASVVNNVICDYVRQRAGCYPSDKPIAYDALDPAGYDPEFCVVKHRCFLADLASDDLDKYRFGSWILRQYERFSINCICWNGFEFKKFGGFVATRENLDDEHGLSVVGPKKFRKFNCIAGDVLCSHFAFFTQREHLEAKTDLLSDYLALGLTRCDFYKEDRDDHSGADQRAV